MNISGSIARHWDSLSTLRSESHPSPRKTRFRLLAKLCRAGFVNPQGRDERFLSSSLFLLSRAFLAERHPSFVFDKSFTPPIHFRSVETGYG